MRWSPLDNEGNLLVTHRLSEMNNAKCEEIKKKYKVLMIEDPTLTLGTKTAIHHISGCQGTKVFAPWGQIRGLCGVCSGLYMRITFGKL